MLISLSDYLELATRGYAMAYDQHWKTAPFEPEDWVADPSGLGLNAARRIFLHLTEIEEGLDVDSCCRDERLMLLAACQISRVALIMSNPPTVDILAQDCDIAALISPTCAPFLAPAGFVARDLSKPEDVENEQIGDWRVHHIAWKIFNAHLLLEQEYRMAKAQALWSEADAQKRIARLQRRLDELE
ncbi:hypothetical protein [Aquisediminimonas profunda]|uniref:hypothetical protein n=1 Tax=Aquisediminimonas profunda TaxID=1550733 RepID=UPI001C632411|nr:hypothetical protein [Aquisediminimonas profunda]